MDGHRTCPYCAEEIHAAALRCPHCRSHLPAGDAQPWRRDHPDRRVAGVAVAAAHAFGVPVASARVVFIVLTFIHFLGPTARSGSSSPSRRASHRCSNAGSAPRATSSRAFSGGGRSSPEAHSHDRAPAPPGWGPTKS